MRRVNNEIIGDTRMTKMKIAVITGANGNLGRGFLKTLTQLGYLVYAVDVKLNKIRESEMIKPVRLDITNERMINKFYKKIKRMDVLINNAGIGVFTPFEDRTVKEFRRVTDVNLLGAFLMSRSAVKIMKMQKSGKIVNIGSIYGQVSSDPGIYGHSGRNNSEVYSITKAGIIMLTKYMAAYFSGYNIQINCISPGGIFNKQSGDFAKNYISKTPTGRMAMVNDMQSALRFLVSEDSGYVNGQNITVDGGFTAW